MTKYILICGGGHASVVADIIERNDNKLVGYYDDNHGFREELKLGKISDINQNFEENIGIHCAVGDCILRSKIVKNISLLNNYNWCTIIDRTANLSKHIIIGRGSLVGINTVINTNVCIGDHSIINTGSIIEHDCKIGDFVHIAPRVVICGNVTIGNNTFIGAGTVVKEKIKIGDNVIIGAGSVVVTDIRSNVVAYGGPCRVMREYYPNL